jgi:hypothetical protein
MALSDRETGGLDSVGWQFGFKLKTEHVWDAFVLLSLLRDSSAHTCRLELPHKGFQHSHFTKAMEEWNEHIVMEGQDEIGHSCDKCTQYYEVVDADGTKTLLDFNAYLVDISHGRTLFTSLFYYITYLGYFELRPTIRSIFVHYSLSPPGYSD